MIYTFTLYFKGETKKETGRQKQTDRLRYSQRESMHKI